MKTQRKPESSWRKITNYCVWRRKVAKAAWRLLGTRLKFSRRTYVQYRQHLSKTDPKKDFHIHLLLKASPWVQTLPFSQDVRACWTTKLLLRSATPAPPRADNKGYVTHPESPC